MVQPVCKYNFNFLLMKDETQVQSACESPGTATTDQAQPSCLPERVLPLYKSLFSSSLTDLVFVLWDIWALFQGQREAFQGI